ncbi:MAG: SPASM domain-containing protein, partial [Candidatus Muiribacteriaceae bacterium]
HIDDIYRIYRFLVMKENYSEAVLFRERFSELTDSKYQLTFNEEKSFDMDGPRDIINFKRVYENDLEAAHRRHREVTENLGGKPTYFYSGDLQRPVCPAPFRTPIINWDGQMTVCCPDDRLELTIGNLNDNSFSELWFSEKADIFRQKILKKDYDKIDRCSRCGNYAGYPLKREEIQLYDKKYSKIN